MGNTAKSVRHDASVMQTRRRPLCLNVSHITTVALDGPALRVEASGRAVMRYPLARIARIVTRGPVQWRTEALCALMEAGIPVVFAGARGKHVGYCWPAERSPVPLVARLGELLDRPDWRACYLNWLRAQRMRILAEWRRAQEQAGNPVHDWKFTKLVRSRVYCPEWHAETEDDSLRRCSIVALVAGQAAQAGLSPEYCAWGDAQLDLVSDIADLLGLILDLDLGGFGAAMQGDEPAMLWVLSPSYSRLAEHCTALLGRFARWVREVSAPWH